MTGQGRGDMNALLAKSLKELAVQEPIEKITIKEITDKAGVIRPTFYNHFQDKYELLEWIINTELIEPMLPLLMNNMQKEAVVLILSQMEKDKSFYSHAIRMDGVITFDDVARKCAKELFLKICEEVGRNQKPKYGWLTPELISGYYAQSLCFAVTEWVRTGMEISPRDMAEAYDYILTHSMSGILQDLILGGKA